MTTPDDLRTLAEAMEQLIIDANRLCDRNLGGTYEEDCRRSITVARRALAAAQGTPHRCSGCGHRWEGELKGAELCGDCWRRGQSVIFAPEMRSEYEFDYSQAKPNRFVGTQKEPCRHRSWDMGRCIDCFKTANQIEDERRAAEAGDPTQ